MDAISLAAAIFKLSKLQCREPQPYADCLQRYLQLAASATPRTLSNVVYALCKAPAAIRRQHQVALQQQLLPALMARVSGASTQQISSVMYGMAVSGQQLKRCQLQQLLDAFLGKLPEANPQAVSNTLWAVAAMGQQVPAEQLQQLLVAFVGMLHRANPQDVSNMLLSCAKLSFLPQQLLAAPGLAGLLQAGTAQCLANAAWACGQLGHRDEQLIGALLAKAGQQLVAAGSCASGHSSSSPLFTTQNLCNLCWAVAVLNLQQHAQQVLQLAQACSSQWDSMAAEEQQQLWQVHTWLLDFQLAGGQGLQGSLTQQQLQQCHNVRSADTSRVARLSRTTLQRSVFAAVQRLPIAWQQQPQMEQLSAGRDGVTPDHALLLDIAGRTAAGVLVAVDLPLEADGPWHFRQPDGGLMGTTQYRNRALAVRGYSLVSVPGHAWDKLRSDEQRQQYLLHLFEQGGVL